MFFAKVTRELDRLIAGIESRHSKFIPVEMYRELSKKLKIKDQQRINARLTQLGYVVSEFAQDLNGNDIAADISVVNRLADPISLSRAQDKHIAVWKTKFSDEIFEFSSSPESWNRLAGRAGVALVRDGIVIDIVVTVMN